MYCQTENGSAFLSVQCYNAMLAHATSTISRIQMQWKWQKALRQIPKYMFYSFPSVRRARVCIELKGIWSSNNNNKNRKRKKVKEIFRGKKPEHSAFNDKFVFKSGAQHSTPSLCMQHRNRECKTIGMFTINQSKRRAKGRKRHTQKCCEHSHSQPSILYDMRHSLVWL